MDPDANLAEQLELARSFVETGDGDPEDLERLAQLVIALYEWIENGGALPAAWVR